MSDAICDGLRVIEFGDGMSCGLAGMILADNGAEVIKVEPPAGAESRANPAFAMWARGKKSIVLDLEQEADLRSAHALVRSADIVMGSFAPGEAARLGLDHARGAMENPGLITLSLSGFGQVERLEPLGMVEPIVVARSGRSCNNHPLAGSHVGGRAIHIAAPAASCGAAFLAVQGVMAALIARLRTGRGQEVSTSLLDGLSAATMRLAFERHGDEIIPVEARGGGADLVLRCIHNCFIAPECADGRYIQMCARQVQHFRNWLAAMDLGHLLDDPRFSAAPLGLRSFEDADALEAMIRAAMKKRTMAEWIEIFSTKYDVGADPFLLPDEFLRHPQMVLNDRVVTLDDPEKGPVTQVGPLALFAETPSRIERPAPRLGEHQGDIDALIASRRGDQAPPPQGAGWEGQDRPPLEGITILELAYFLAAPLAATTLAELGARVIKVEPVAGDPFRTSGLEFVHIVAGKESIGLDLKSPEGQEVFGRLVAGCDALLHNFRPGAPERLKVDYASVRAANPDIVYLYGASYGSHGPESHRPAFHSTPNALCGGGILQAGRGNPPIDESYPDPIAGLGAGVALAMGLYMKARCGVGQYVETTMLTSSGYAHSEMLTRFADAPAMPEMDAGQHGLDALYRLYRGSDGAYVFIAARGQEDWVRLATAIGRGDLAEDPRFADAAARRAHDAELIDILTPLFETRAPDAWEALLRAAGVHAAAVFPSFERFLAEEGFLDQGEHPAFGTYWKLKPRVRFSAATCRVGEPSAIGEHSLALLREAGYDPDEVAALVRVGAVRVLERAPEPA